MKWNWIQKEVVLAIHDQQIAEHGGAAGIRDLGLIESALARPKNLVNYSTPDVFDLAGADALPDVKGQSVARFLTGDGEVADWPDQAISEILGGDMPRMIRRGDWKLGLGHDR